MSSSPKFTTEHHAPTPARLTTPASHDLESRAAFLTASAQAAGFPVTAESTRALLAKLDAPTERPA